MTETGTESETYAAEADRGEEPQSISLDDALIDTNVSPLPVEPQELPESQVEESTPERLEPISQAGSAERESGEQVPLPTDAEILPSLSQPEPEALVADMAATEVEEEAATTVEQKPADENVVALDAEALLENTEPAAKVALTAEPVAPEVELEVVALQTEPESVPPGAAPSEATHEFEEVSGVEPEQKQDVAPEPDALDEPVAAASAVVASPFSVLPVAAEPHRSELPEPDPELVRAAVTIALDRAMPALIDELTEHVLTALRGRKRE